MHYVRKSKRCRHSLLNFGLFWSSIHQEINLANLHSVKLRYRLPAYLNLHRFHIFFADSKLDESTPITRLSWYKEKLKQRSFLDMLELVWKCMLKPKVYNSKSFPINIFCGNMQHTCMQIITLVQNKKKC